MILLEITRETAILLMRKTKAQGDNAICPVSHGYEQAE